MRTATANRRASRWGLAALACALVLAAGPGGAARAADQIEDNLPAQGYKVIKFLKKKGYQNVGVLNFRVEKDNKLERARVPLKAALATALENVLLLMNDKSEPIGIIHDAGHVAAKQKEKATYLTPQGCEKLFRYQYPLAWGNKWVTADAFVTGVVKINPIKRTTTVTLEAIDRKTKKPVPVPGASFEVRTDRGILTDVCTNFALAKRQIRTMAAQDLEKEANDKGNDPDKNNKKGQPEERLVDLEILYDNERQEERPGRVDPRSTEIDEPKENTKVVLRIKNLSDKRVAVRLAVNGKNTLYQEDITQLSEGGGTKWVLDPGKQYEILGFYKNDDKSYEPFKVLSDEASEQEELETKVSAAAIQMVVYEEGSAGGDTMVKTQGLRKVLPLAEARLRSAREASKLVQNLKGSTRSTGLIKPDPDAKEADLQTVPFKDPRLQESRTIWYYFSKKNKGSGN